MAFSSPEHPDIQPENAAPERPSEEPRLLTRRDPADGAGESGPAEPRHFPQGQTTARRPLQRHLHLRTLDALRARLVARRARQASGSGPGSDGKPHRRWRFAGRALRRLLVSLAVVLLVCGLAMITIALLLRHDMQAALPQLDGDLHLAGLTAPVTVTRDSQGVPNIQAATLNDVLFAQGFVTAQDRLWQMDSLRRHAAGELAEILGPSLVEHDRLQRFLQLRAAADRAVLTLPPEQLAQLQAYARGVNAFLEANADRLPVEFHLLHYTPAPWTPRDSLLIGLAIFQDLGTSFPTKLKREAFSRHLPPEFLADLYPTRSFRDQPPTQPRRDLTAPQPEVLQIPLDDTQVKLNQPSFGPKPEELLAALAPFEPHCGECRAGSNNWAVAGSHSASGKPLVSNDMHLGLSVPDIWYEAGLHTTASPGQPAFDVSGFTLPGVPFVVVGRNAHVAWSVTNLGADLQDLHIEHLRGSGDATEFQQADGSWAPVAHHRELIHVRGGRDRVLDVLTTSTRIGNVPQAGSDASADAIATPIISPLFPNEHRALSLLWTPYDPHNLTAPFYAINAAASGSALVTAYSSFGGPSLNLVYADDAGHIGYHAVGRIPIRGPAERRPRVHLPQDVPDNGNPPPDEQPDGETNGDNPSDKPQARLSELGGHFVTAGYAVTRRRRGHRAEAPERAPSRRTRAQPEPVKSLPEKPIPPAIPALDYTVGSPLPGIPIDALDAAAHWSAYVPYEELPAIQDPADGILATANARIAADDYPYFLADDWAPPYRVERIRKLLAGRTGLTPADMLPIETDTHSAFERLLAERLAYAIDHASPKTLKDARRLHQAADLLRTWNGDMAVDSPAAAIVAAVRPELWSMLLAPQIARHDHLSSTDSHLAELATLYQWAGQTVALETLLTFQPDRWLPPDFGNWNDFLAAAVSRGLSQSSAPHDLSRWKYGSVHPVDLEHPVFSLSPLLPRMLDVRTGTGAQPIAGDGTTIQATARAFGPSERFTADLADPAATLGNITTGQSGNPASPHYLDQFPAWLHGSSFAMPLNGAPAQHTLRLLP